MSCLVFVTIFIVLTHSSIHQVTSSNNCTTPNNESANCVSLYSCPILLKALGSQDETALRFVHNSTCGGDASNPMVCCGSTSNFIEQNTVSSESFINLLPDKKYCGLQHSDDFFHTINVSALSEFPWLAKIHAQNKLHPFLYGFYCGGALISARYVLTAANCLLDKTYILQYVRLGEYNYWNETDCLEDSHIYECIDTVEDFCIEEAIPHPEYTEYNYGCPVNDIGLIRLHKNVIYTDYIRPICLPLLHAPKLTIGSTIITTHCAGANVKEKLFRRLDPIDSCLERLPANHPHLKEVWMCGVANTSTKTCYDQLGNPLMFSSRKHQWFLVGLVPGRGRNYSCYEGYRQSYTNVTFYLGWIASVMRP